MNEALASKIEKIVALGIALKNSKPIHTVDLRSDGNDLMGKNNSAGPPSKPFFRVSFKSMRKN